MESQWKQFHEDTDDVNHDREFPVLFSSLLLIFSFPPHPL